ncbi:hypothetical protein IW262DRAFT_1292907 [Armillaria fumosa]|nr:hypothetical protein IW262DRAFT_1292907 [Armillaria fumosa]
MRACTPRGCKRRKGQGKDTQYAVEYVQAGQKDAGNDHSNPPPDLRHNRFETLDCVVINYGAGRTCNNSQGTEAVWTPAEMMINIPSIPRPGDGLKIWRIGREGTLCTGNHTTQVTEDQAKSIVSMIRNLEGACSRSIPRNVEHLVIDGENLQLEANAALYNRRCLNHRDCVEKVVQGASISYSFKSLCVRADERITELLVVNQSDIWQ